MSDDLLIKCWNVPPRFSEPWWQESSSHDSSSRTLHSISDTHSEWWVTPLWFFPLSHISKLNLNSGGEIDSVDKDGNTPLHIAARYGHELLINTLITNGADCTRFVSCRVENCSVVPNMMSLTDNTAASVKARCPWHVPAPPGCLERSLRLLQETALLRYNFDTSASFLIKLAVWSSTTSTLTVLGGNWLFMWLTWCSQEVIHTCWTPSSCSAAELLWAVGTHALVFPRNHQKNIWILMKFK